MSFTLRSCQDGYHPQFVLAAITVAYFTESIGAGIRNEKLVGKSNIKIISSECFFATGTELSEQDNTGI